MLDPGRNRITAALSLETSITLRHVCDILQRRLMESGTLRPLSCFIASSNRPEMEWPSSLLLCTACVMHWGGYSNTERPQRTTQWHIWLLAEPHTAVCVICWVMKSRAVFSLHFPAPSSLSCQGLSRPMAAFHFRALVGKDPLTKL